MGCILTQASRRAHGALYESDHSPCAVTEHTAPVPSELSPPWYSLSFHIPSSPKIAGINTKLEFCGKRCHACLQSTILAPGHPTAAPCPGCPCDKHVYMSVSKGTDCCTCKPWKSHQSTAERWGRHTSRKGYRDIYRIWQKWFWSVKGLNAHTTKFSFKFSADSPAMS